MNIICKANLPPPPQNLVYILFNSHTNSLLFTLSGQTCFCHYIISELVYKVLRKTLLLVVVCTTALILQPHMYCVLYHSGQWHSVDQRDQYGRRVPSAIELYRGADLTAILSLGYKTRLTKMWSHVPLWTEDARLLCFSFSPSAFSCLLAVCLCADGWLDSAVYPWFERQRFWSATRGHPQRAEGCHRCRRFDDRHPGRHGRENHPLLPFRRSGAAWPDHGGFGCDFCEPWCRNPPCPGSLDWLSWTPCWLSWHSTTQAALDGRCVTDDPRSAGWQRRKSHGVNEYGETGSNQQHC